MSKTCEQAKTLLDEMSSNYSQWQNERAPVATRKVHAIEEIDLNSKIDKLIAMLSKEESIENLVEKNEIDVNYVGRNSYGNNGFRNNNNFQRPYPSNNYAPQNNSSTQNSNSYDMLK